METTFTLPDLPGVTFTVVRGGNADDPAVPSNWLAITGVDSDGKVVFQVGAAGP